jgi:hypothetical protein
MYRIDHTVLLKQKKGPVLDITGFFFRMSTHVKAEVRSTKAVTLLRMRKQILFYPIWENSFVSIIMYLTCTIIVLLKKYMVWYVYMYIFTLLMFRKSNKTTINKNKTTNFYLSKSFRFSFIFRYFKVFQVSQIFTCVLVWFVITFCIARIHFKSSHTRQFWT